MLAPFGLLVASISVLSWDLGLTLGLARALHEVVFGALVDTVMHICGFYFGVDVGVHFRS